MSFKRNDKIEVNMMFHHADCRQGYILLCIFVSDSLCFVKINSELTDWSHIFNDMSAFEFEV